jgi:hypothetical protein
MPKAVRGSCIRLLLRFQDQQRVLGEKVPPVVLVGAVNGIVAAPALVGSSARSST